VLPTADPSFTPTKYRKTRALKSNPSRFFKPRTSGALNKTSVNPHELQKAKLTYHDMMGWTEQGIPKQSTLEELDIAWAANKISAQ